MTRLTPTTALALCKLLSPAFLLWLSLTLPQPAVAQTTTPPALVPIQQLAPTDADIYPTPGSAPRLVGFGAAVAIQRDTAIGIRFRQSAHAASSPSSRRRKTWKPKRRKSA